MRVAFIKQEFRRIHHVGLPLLDGRLLRARLHQEMAARRAQHHQEEQQKRPAQPQAFLPGGHNRQRRDEKQHRQDEVAVEVCALDEHKAEQVDEKRGKRILYHAPLHARCALLRVKPPIHARRHDAGEHQHCGDAQVRDARQGEQRRVAPPAQQLEEVRKDRRHRGDHRLPVQRVEHERARRAHAALEQPRVEELRGRIARGAREKARRRHPAEAQVMVPKRAARLRREQHIKARHNHHRADKAQHIAHRQQALEQTHSQEQRQRRQAAPSAPSALGRGEPQRRAAKREGQVDNVVPADGHVGGVQRTRRKGQQGRRAQALRHGKPQRPAQEHARKHAEHKADRVADDAREHKAVREQEGQRIQQIHVDRVNLRGVDPVHLNQAAGVRLAPRENHLRGHVAVEVGEIARLLQRDGQRQRQHAQRDAQHERPAPLFSLHARVLLCIYRFCPIHLPLIIALRIYAVKPTRSTLSRLRLYKWQMLV